MTATAPITPQAPTAAAMIAADAVTKSFAAGRRQVEILHGISLQVFPGELVSIMGPSGSGKSTLLYCLAGLEQPTTGRVGLLGQDLSTLGRAQLARLRRSEVGFVFQSYNLVPTLSAYENVTLPWLLRGEKADRSMVEGVMATVGLGDLIDARPTSMSGGEQQRVALARVLAQQPRIVFADEPTGALDTTTGRIVLDELTAMAHTDGRCVLTVTHDPVVAARSDRTLFVRDGLIVDELANPTVDAVTDLMRTLGRGGIKGEL